MANVKDGLRDRYSHKISDCRTGILQNTKTNLNYNLNDGLSDRYSHKISDFNQLILQNSEKIVSLT